MLHHLQSSQPNQPNLSSGIHAPTWTHCQINISQNTSTFAWTNADAVEGVGKRLPPFFSFPCSHCLSITNFHTLEMFVMQVSFRFLMSNTPMEIAQKINKLYLLKASHFHCAEFKSSSIVKPLTVSGPSFTENQETLYIFTVVSGRKVWHVLLSITTLFLICFSAWLELKLNFDQ